MFDNLSMVKFLLNHGADPNAQTTRLQLTGNCCDVFNHFENEANDIFNSGHVGPANTQRREFFRRSSIPPHPRHAKSVVVGVTNHNQRKS